MRHFLAILLIFSFLHSTSQILVINELDADDPSTDDMEFVEIKSQTPNFSTDGFILVFFNGSSSGGDSSYLVIDLNGYETDGNGLLVVGNLNVSPFPQGIFQDGIIQNGADAVGIYQASVNDFPGGTLATTTDLIDALVYDTNDADDPALMALLGETVQYNDNGTTANPRSLQRQNDGTYLAQTPTPRALNDGTGVVLNPITISVDQEQYNEGENFTITFTAALNVSEDTNFDITLSNGTFTTGDFSGSTTLTIPSGQNSTSTFIVLLDDPNDEGDEELVIEMFNLENVYLPTTMINPPVAGNNRIKVRVVDNDFTVASWGTPLNPTYDQVTSTQPAGYYSSLDETSGSDLRQAIEDIIADENTVRAHPYADVVEILKSADQNPLNSNEVWLLYTEQGRAKLDVQNSSFSAGKWNREHTFPRSLGGFDEWEDFDDIPTGINSFIATKVDSTRHAYSDAHALRAADAQENSRRSNRHYGTVYNSDFYNGPSNVDPLNNIGISFRGDVARSVLFLELRYNNLQVINGSPSSTGNLGDLATLLQWHEDDPPDDYEMNRNNIVYQWQQNRNPLIDLPELVDFIWGSQAGETFTLSNSAIELSEIRMYPNPTQDVVYFSGLSQTTEIKVYGMDGRKMNDLIVDSDNKANLDLPSGVYLLEFRDSFKVQTKRLVVN